VCCILAGLTATAAHAQSSATLQGMIDGGVTYVNNQHGGSATLFDSGILAPNLLTFKGSEDLCGGNKAIFDLTSQFDLRQRCDDSWCRANLQPVSVCRLVK
jgi:predicted porin